MELWCANQCRKARLAQSVERQTLNLVVEGSSPSVGASFVKIYYLSINSNIVTQGQGRVESFAQKWLLHLILSWSILVLILDLT